ncbi:MAG: methyltransferase domain-containing protein [Bacteroidota bacterium]
MKGYGIVSLLLTVFLLSACVDPSSETTKKPFVTEHNYAEDTKSPSRSVTLPGGNVASDNEDLLEKYRHVWQRPFEVIQQIGDLKGKTVADIGAGPLGYFSILIAAQNEVDKVIAIDIDQAALDYIEDAKKKWTDHLEKIETRLALPDDPRLQEREVDVVLIVNTAIYFKDRINYFRNLRKGLRPGGQLVIIDFKKRNTPVGPPAESRISLFDMERELQEAGYTQIKADDQTLEYQYIVKAGVPE